MLSVLNQSFTDFEYIVIDGASCDGTGDVIAKFDAELAYVVSEPDQGIYHAINKGIAAARGEFVYLAHAGDMLMPDALETLIAAPQLSAGSILYSDYMYDGELVSVPDRLGVGFNLYNMRIAHQTLLVPRALYATTAGYYRTDLKIVADYCWMRAAYRAGIDFHKVPKALQNIDASGYSTLASVEVRELFRTEFCDRTREYYPFVPKYIARAAFDARHSSSPLKTLARWIATDLATMPVSEAARSEFRLALESYLKGVKESRAGITKRRCDTDQRACGA